MIMYKILKDDLTKREFGVRRIQDGASIPFDPDNTDYQAYLKWLDEGNTPLPAEVTA